MIFILCQEWPNIGPIKILPILDQSRASGHLILLQYWDPIPGGGALTYIDGTGMCRGQDPQFTADRSFLKTPISSKVVSSLAIFKKFEFPRPPFQGNFRIFWLRSPKLTQKFSSQGSFLESLSSQDPLFRGYQPLPRPPVRKSGPHIPTKTKVECPPPRHLLHHVTGGVRLTVPPSPS